MKISPTLWAFTFVLFVCFKTLALNPFTEIKNTTPSDSILFGSFENKFKRYLKREQKQGPTLHSWEAVSWKGERISKQIILWSKAYIGDLEYEIEDLSDSKGNVIPASAFHMGFFKYVKGDSLPNECGAYENRTKFVEIADAISEEKVSSLSPLDPLKIWLSVDVPSSSKAGLYKGHILVRSAEKKAGLVLDISLRVTPHTLPPPKDWSFHLDIWQFPVSVLDRYNDTHPNAPIQLWSDAHVAMLKPAYTLLAASGQKAITAYIKDGAMGRGSNMVKWVKQKNGDWSYDFSTFNTYVTRLMSWGITEQIDCFSPMGWNTNVIPYFDESSGKTQELQAPIKSEVYNERWNHFLTAFKKNLDAKGWFSKTVLFMDEVHEEELLSVLQVIHNNNPNWKVGYAFTRGLSRKISDSLYDVSGILLNQEVLNFLKGAPEIAFGDRKGKITTFYTSCSNIAPNNYVTAETSTSEMTWMAWHALKEGYNGYLRWAFDNWKNEDPLDAREGTHTAGDFSIIYRKDNEADAKVYTSLRLEMLREGIEDYEKVRIIENSNLKNHPKWKDLNKLIQKFDKNSGGKALEFVTQAEDLLHEIY